jgi:hypothetical protein
MLKNNTRSSAGSIGCCVNSNGSTSSCAADRRMLATNQPIKNGTSRAQRRRRNGMESRGRTRSGKEARTITIHAAPSTHSPHRAGAAKAPPTKGGTGRQMGPPTAADPSAGYGVKLMGRLRSGNPSSPAVTQRPTRCQSSAARRTHRSRPGRPWSRRPSPRPGWRHCRAPRNLPHPGCRRRNRRR